jgi:DNA polymerase-3 subunit delta
LDLASPSLFNEPRLIVVHQPPESAISDLQSFLNSDSDQVFVWVRSSSPPALVSKLRKQFSEHAQIVNCDELKGDSARLNFAKQELEAAGKKISTDALRLLCGAFTADLAELASACSQLIAHPSNNIERELVEAVFSGRVETTIFKIADAAFSGNASEAIRLLRHALNTGADPVMMLGALASRIRGLAKLISNPRASAETIGVQPWMLDRMRRDLTGWSESELTKLVRKTSEVDAAVKGASRDPEYVLESFLLGISTRTVKK